MTEETARVDFAAKNDAEEQLVSLYAAEKKIYPRELKGRFQSLRLTAMVVLLGIYYFMPWFMYGDHQAILFDLPARKFHIFGWTVWPQDFVYLAALLILAALSLFFFTALAGRLWCGYACPQTVWTEAFLLMERWTEGDFRKRQKLDAGPWTSEKLRRKLAKHSLWLVFALWTGFTFVGFFSPIRELAKDVWHLQLGGWELFWGLFYSLATWGNAGILREQVCKYMCPYARFQSAMFDKDTLIISYDVARGESRGSRRKTIPSVLVEDRRSETFKTGLSSLVATAVDNAKAMATKTAALPGASPTGLGDCIDCKICVQVCPTGIDIRNGLQYECIACGSCIDACDDVMDKIGYPRGLVRYTTQHALEHKPKHILRPRVMIYAALLLGIAGSLLFSILTRDKLHLDVVRDRNALYRSNADGSVENTYTFKLINKDSRAHPVEIRIKDTGIKNLGTLNLMVQPSIEVPAESTLGVTGTIRGDAETIGMQAIEFIAVSRDEQSIQAVQKSRFFAPSEPR